MDKGFSVFPFYTGYIRAEYENGAIAALHFVQDCKDFGTPTGLTEQVFREFQEYLEGRRQEFTFPMLLHGTAFQKKVWEALLAIPYGEVRTYGQIAKEIGCPKGSRAVGMACNRNPLIIAVPCHRVVGAKGALTGYACGLPMKQDLLALERETISKGNL